MARQIIKQPNGKLAIWSSIIDDFIMTNATAEEYIDFRVAEETERLNKEIPVIVSKLKNGETIGYYDLSWDTALEVILERHGKERLDILLESLK